MIYQGICKECYYYKKYKPNIKEKCDPSSQWYNWKRGDPTYIYCEVLKKLHVPDIQPDPNDKACEFFKYKRGFRYTAIEEYPLNYEDYNTKH